MRIRKGSTISKIINLTILPDGDQQEVFKERQTLHHKTPIRSFVVKSNAIERAMPCQQDSKLSPPEVDPAMLQRQTMIARFANLLDMS